MSEPVESKIKTIPCSPGSLCFDEIAEIIELEIGGTDGARFTSQGCADDDNCASIVNDR